MTTTETAGMRRWLSDGTGLQGAQLTDPALSTWQLDRLREAAAYAREKSRFYAKTMRDVNLQALTSQQALQTIPLCSSADLREDPAAFLCVPQREVERITTIFTSGSTGRPKRVFFTRGDLERTVAFFAAGMSCIVGPGVRVAILMPGQTPGSVGALLEQALVLLGARPIPCGAVADYDAAGEMLRRQRPDCIVGIPAQVARLAKQFPHLPVPKLLLSADYIPDSVIRLLRELWGAEVFCHYGMTEMGFGGGVDCARHMGYHLRSADLLFEIVDPVRGLPVPDGMVGEVVFSTLNREAMPLIRYRTGDLDAARLLRLWTAGSEIGAHSGAARRHAAASGRWKHLNSYS